MNRADLIGRFVTLHAENRDFNPTDFARAFANEIPGVRQSSRSQVARGVLKAMRSAIADGATTPSEVAAVVADWVIDEASQ